MKIWKLIAHHEAPNEAISWSIDNGRIVVGWGNIGDLREHRCTGGRDIATRIRQHYPDARNDHTGGPSLWNFFSGMQPGDLVIVVGRDLAGRNRRLHVVEVTGPYVWASAADSFGDYQHQRSGVVTDDDSDQLWASVGAEVAEGHSTRWTVALCCIDAPAWAARERYSEGSRFDIAASSIERNPQARRACINHHGCRCAVCSIDFSEKYGDLGRGFIHVHHLKPFAETAGKRVVDPVSDLIPLCPNCHAMVHRCRPPLTLEQLRERLRC